MSAVITHLTCLECWGADVMPKSQHSCVWVPTAPISQLNFTGSLVLTLVYYAVIGLLLDFAFQIRGRGSERTMRGPIPSPHLLSSSRPLMNFVTISVLGGELPRNVYNHKNSKQVLPLPVCACWTESRESSLSPCPYGRCLPTSPCSSDLTDCTF